MLNATTRFFRRRRWSVTTKISLCLAFLALILFISSVLTIFFIELQKDSVAVERQKSSALNNVTLFDQSLNTTLNTYNDAIYLSQNKSVVNRRYQNDTKAALDKVKQDNAGQLQQPDSLIAQIVRDYDQLTNIFVQANTLLQNGEADQVVVLWASSLEQRRTTIANTKAFWQILEQEQKQAAQNSNFATTTTTITAITAGVLGTLFAILCAWLLSATIGKPLATTRKFLEGVAAGDFTKQLTLDNRDELGDLARVLNNSVRTLHGVVESFDIGSEVELAARNLRTISSEQAVLSGEQVERITQIGVALEQLTRFARDINDNANMVANAATTTFDQAQQVNAITSQVSENMQRLETTVSDSVTATSQANEDFNLLIEQLQYVDSQSQNVQAVVSIIADIARKIHLLALNASIEAAGAGQYGDRFRQVAGQIKELAVHSAGSARNSSELLLSSRRLIQQTVSQALQNQDSINRVVELSTRVATLAKETTQISQSNHEAVQKILEASAYSAQQATQIKTATQQQENSSQQILATVDTISQTTRLTAERSSAVAGTSTELDGMSQSLAARLAELKLPALSTN